MTNKKKYLVEGLFPIYFLLRSFPYIGSFPYKNAPFHFKLFPAQDPVFFNRYKSIILKNFFMKNFLFYILLLLTGLSSQAQQLITGKVKNKDNDSSIVGVSVSVKGSSNVTVTDETGSFSLNIPSLPVTLVISHVGFVT